MRRCLGRSGVAALEMALLAPILVLLMVSTIDFGVALLSKAKTAQVLAGSAEYDTLAGQNKVAPATIAANAGTLAAAAANAFITKPSTTAVINNGQGATAQCCPGSTWVCGTAGSIACADGSTPGVYLTLTARYSFQPLFPADTYLTGTTLAGSVVAPLQ